MSVLTAIKHRLKSTKAKVGAMIVLLVVAALGGLFAVRAMAAPVSTPNCDANAVVNCGATSPNDLISKYDNGDGRNSVGSIHNIYNCVGITAAALGALPSENVNGYVTNTGDVYANGVLVATGAITGGRQDIGGAASTPVNCNGTTFWERHPQTSFLDPELAAMVDMKNGVFQYAILNSCGNPVIATPKQPAYTIQKQVRVAGTNTWSSDVTAMAGQEVQYMISVRSTGQVPAINLTIGDTLPQDIQFISGSMLQDGVPQTDATAHQFFNGGVFYPVGLNPGDATVFTFNAIAGPNETYANCTPEVLNNVGFISSPELPGQQSGASVNKQCQQPPKVSLACNELTLTPGQADVATGNTPYTLAANASAQNATITGFVFNLGNGQTKTVATNATSASTTNTYAPGTYTVSVAVTATANGVTYTQSSDNCVGKITVNAPPQAVVTCNELTLTPGQADVATGNTPYTLAATASAQNATINSYTFTFGDNSQNQTVTTGNPSANTTHTYAPSSYTPSVQVTATTNTGKVVSVTSAKCAGKITIGTPPQAVYTCDELTASPVGSADAAGNVAYSLVAKASAQNATITGYTFTFGDNSQPKTITTSDTTATAAHTYAPGTYTPQVTVTVKLADGSTKQVTGPNCNAQVTVTPPPATCTSPTTGQKYPAGSPQCQPAPTCTSPSGQTYPMGSPQCTPGACQPGGTPAPGSPECTPTPPAPTELVNTGPGQVIGLFIGTVIAGFVGHKLILSRRARRLAPETETTTL